MNAMLLKMAVARRRRISFIRKVANTNADAMKPMTSDAADIHCRDQWVRGLDRRDRFQLHASHHTTAQVTRIPTIATSLLQTAQPYGQCFPPQSKFVSYCCP
jgi:hypothetical protein